MKQFNCFTVRYSKAQEALFWEMKGSRIPNFCLQSLYEFKEFGLWVKDYFATPDRPLKYIISTSKHPDIYNMGGDLLYFVDNIKQNNTENLTQYAHLCVDAIYNIYNAFGLSVITIALVQGNAYGGGFECALAHDYILAGDKVQFCLPENKFNLFAGMGAYSLLYRKLNTVAADTIIKSGKIYTAKHLQSLGLVERLFSTKNGGTCLANFITTLTPKFNFEYHHLVCKKRVFPLQKSELIEITDLWVTACMSTSVFNLRQMEVLANAQSYTIKLEV